MSAILNLIGWPVGVCCAAMAAWRLWRMAAPPRHPRTGERPWRDALGLSAWIGLLIWSGAAVAVFAFLGVIGPVAGALYAGAAAVLVIVLARAWTREGRHALRGHLTLAPRETAREAGRSGRSLFGRARRFLSTGEEAADGAIPLEAVAEHAAARAIPPVMEDPHLGPATEPAEIAAAGIPVPPPYAALAQFIAGFEPEDDQALRMFMDGHASGMIAVADAWHAFADQLLNGVGLSPAYVAGILEAGDSAGEHASLLAQVHKRFTVVYSAVKEWIAAHGPLPHKAREFLTGEEG